MFEFCYYLDVAPTPALQPPLINKNPSTVKPLFPVNLKMLNLHLQFCPNNILLVLPKLSPIQLIVFFMLSHVAKVSPREAIAKDVLYILFLSSLQRPPDYISSISIIMLLFNSLILLLFTNALTFSHL